MKVITEMCRVEYIIHLRLKYSFRQEHIIEPNLPQLWNTVNDEKLFLSCSILLHLSRKDATPLVFFAFVDKYRKLILYQTAVYR